MEVMRESSNNTYLNEATAAKIEDLEEQNELLRSCVFGLNAKIEQLEGTSNNDDEGNKYEQRKQSKKDKETIRNLSEQNKLLESSFNELKIFLDEQIKDKLKQQLQMELKWCTKTRRIKMEKNDIVEKLNLKNSHLQKEKKEIEEELEEQVTLLSTQIQTLAKQKSETESMNESLKFEFEQQISTLTKNNQLLQRKFDGLEAAEEKKPLPKQPIAVQKPTISHPPRKNKQSNKRMKLFLSILVLATVLTYYLSFYLLSSYVFQQNNKSNIQEHSPNALVGKSVLPQEEILEKHLLFLEALPQIHLCPEKEKINATALTKIFNNLFSRRK